MKIMKISNSLISECLEVIKLNPIGLDQLTEQIAKRFQLPESTWLNLDGKFQARVRYAVETLVRNGSVKKTKRYGMNNGHSYSNVYQYIQPSSPNSPT